LRGSGRFAAALAAVAVWREVSIPFIAGQWSLLEALSRLRSRAEVSIPFIAGQWSLLGTIITVSLVAIVFQSPSLRGSGRFALEPERAKRLENQVSIPFIAGQWSLPAALRTAPGRRAGFQSPSLRGSGRFKEAPIMGALKDPCFNPLHCGAVVASSKPLPSR